MLNSSKIIVNILNKISDDTIFIKYFSFYLSIFLFAHMLRQVFEISKTLMAISGYTKNWEIFSLFIYIFPHCMNFYYKHVLFL